LVLDGLLVGRNPDVNCGPFRHGDLQPVTQHASLGMYRNKVFFVPSRIPLSTEARSRPYDTSSWKAFQYVRRPDCRRSKDT
jgi:hypothetical protein